MGGGRKVSEGKEKAVVEMRRVACRTYPSAIPSPKLDAASPATEKAPSTFFCMRLLSSSFFCEARNKRDQQTSTRREEMQDRTDPLDVLPAEPDRVAYRCSSLVGVSQYDVRGRSDVGGGGR